MYNRGRLQQDLGDVDAAKADFTKVVELDLGYKDAAERLSQLRA